MTVRLQSDKSTISYGNDADLLPFSEVLLVTKSEEISREDKRILRRTGCRGIQFFSSGVDTVQYVLDKRKSSNCSYSCMIICHEQLSDMDATTLISLLHLHPRCFVPVLIVVTSNTSFPPPLFLLKIGRKSINLSGLSLHLIAH